MHETFDPLAALAWLVDTGADETILEAPVNRFQGKGTPAQSAVPPATPKTSPALPTHAQEGNTRAGQADGQIMVRKAAVAPTSVLSTRTSDYDPIGQAMEIARTCHTLVELRAALESFEGCALKQFASNTVFADGNPDARIMFIGEAPGFEEDKTGLPFVGRAGKLLDKMLAAIGLDRTSAYITNVLPWRPPDNRNPDLTEVAKCIPFLRRHIELHGPRIIVLLGGSPLRHVLGKPEGILQARGKWLDYYIEGHVIPVMPILHPAYLLRQPAHKRLAWRDLQAVRVKDEQNHGLASPADIS